MNFGGIIAGALGGGAQAAGEIADANLKEQAAERAEKRSLALNFEKFKQEANYKLQMDRQAQERYMADSERVTARASSNMRGQDVAALDMLNNQVGGDSPEMSREEMAKLLEENPQYRQVYEQAGYMAPRRQSGIIGEEVRAARELGADPALRKDLTQAQKDMTVAERDAARERRDEQRYDLQVAREERQAAEGAARLSQGEQRLDLLGQQIAKSGSKDSPDTQEKLNTTINTHRQLITADSERLKSLEVMDPSNPEVAMLREGISRSRAIIAKAQKLQDTNLSGGDAAPTPSPAPAPRPGAAAPAAGGGKFASTAAEKDIAGVLRGQLEENKAALATERDPNKRQRLQANVAELEKQIQALGGSSQSNDNRRSGPGVATPKTFAERDALPPGTKYMAPDGTIRTKS